jgi:hypothetical protein
MRRRSFKTPLTEQWEAATFKLRMLVITVTLLGPPAGMMVMAYDVAVTRYLARHVVQAQAFEAGLPQGQVVAAAGRIRADPVQLPAGYPQFQNALMVIEHHELDQQRCHARWLDSRSEPHQERELRFLSGIAVRSV